MALSSHVETVGAGASKAKLVGAGLLVLAGIAAFYLLSGQSGWVQWLALVAALVGAALVFLWSNPGQDFIVYVRESYNELKKVVWPTRPEAMKMTGYVFVFATVMATFLWLTDTIVGWAIFDLLLGWRS